MSISLDEAKRIALLVTAVWADKFPDPSERAWFWVGVTLWVKDTDNIYRSNLMRGPDAV